MAPLASSSMQNMSTSSSPVTVPCELRIRVMPFRRGLGKDGPGCNLNGELFGIKLKCRGRSTPVDASC
jgi:hypothetical protein